MRAPLRVAGRTALITGAASGIGREIARILAAEGCHLALADRDAAGLAEAVPPRDGLRVSIHPLDVADAAAVAALPDAVCAAHGGVDLLFNNAGIGLTGRFEVTEAEDFDRVMAVNFGGPVAMTRTFLPLLRESDDARIVNVASLWGLLAPPDNAAYTASKHALSAFSRSLARELAGGPVGVTVVYPGGVASGFLDAVRYAGLTEAEAAARRTENARFLSRPADAAARDIVAAVRRRRLRAVIGNDAKAAALLARVFPNAYWRIITGLGRV